mgnify:CR=1 FL=1
MRILTLNVSDEVSDQFLWLLNHFSPHEVAIVDSDESSSDDAYLRTIAGMTESLHTARTESNDNGVSLEVLDW